MSWQGEKSYALERFKIGILTNSRGNVFHYWSIEIVTKN
jgi:hypothetical protein